MHCSLGWPLFYDHGNFFETSSQIMRLGKKIIHTKFEIDRTTFWGGASHLKIWNFKNFALFGYYILLYIVKLKQRIKTSMIMILVNIILWNPALAFVIQSLLKHIEQKKKKFKGILYDDRVAYLLGVHRENLKININHIFIYFINQFTIY